MICSLADTGLEVLSEPICFEDIAKDIGSQRSGSRGYGGKVPTATAFDPNAAAIGAAGNVYETANLWDTIKNSFNIGAYVTCKYSMDDRSTVFI